MSCLAACVVAAAAASASAPSTARLRTQQGCYFVGHSVRLLGTGFAPSTSYAVDIDGVYFGENTTTSTGILGGTLAPGGLAAGVAQAVETLTVSDGSTTASTRFTLTRRAGAALLASGATRARLEAWGFAPNGAGRPLYVHYLGPGRGASTVSAGRASGQCGYLLTRPRAIFPFRPAAGEWTLQVDSSRSYRARPRGPVARIRVRVG